MAGAIGAASSNFPQTTEGRTREQAAAEIAEYAGGGNVDNTLKRAEKCWDQAVRAYNAKCWNFNKVNETLTLSSPAVTSGIGANAIYTLNDSFKAPVRAFLVDSNSKPRSDLRWVNYNEWRTFDTDQSASASRPLWYTAENIHQTGQLWVSPPLDTSNLTWPTLEVVYFRRIALAQQPSSKLNVPVEVDEGIFMLAVARMMQKTAGHSAGRDALIEAKSFQAELAATHEGFADPEYY